MTEKTENILSHIFIYIAAIFTTLYMLFRLFLVCLLVPVVGWWFFSYIFAPYFGYYTHYWEFIFLPLISFSYFFLLVNEKK